MITFTPKATTRPNLCLFLPTITKLLTIRDPFMATKDKIISIEEILWGSGVDRIFRTTCKDFLQVQNEGFQIVERKQKFYIGRYSIYMPQAWIMGLPS